MPRKLVVFAVLALALVAAPTALAANRFAAPTAMGSGDCSSEANACTLSNALSGATAADTVLVLANHGDFNLSAEQDVNQPIPVRGINGRPRLIFSSAQGLFLLAAGASASNLYIQSTGTGTSTFAIPNGGSATNIIAESTSHNADGACFTRDATVTDSVCWAPGAASVAYEIQANLADTNDTLRNVTLYAPGSNGIALEAGATDGNTATVHVANAVARATGGGIDVVPDTASNPMGTVVIDLTHSNYATSAPTAGSTGSMSVNDDGTKQTALPQFVGAATGDFHEVATSPTIDAGTNTGVGANETDFDGDPRTIAGVTDIGADELRPAPTVVTGGASSVGQTAATIAGTVNPNDSATTYRFDYGTTTAYGSSTAPASAGSGLAAQAVSATLGGLVPGATYHYRLEATNAIGTTFGADRTFSTVSPAHPKPRCSLAPGARVSKRGVIRVAITCDQAARVVLGGRVKEKVRAAHRRVAAGRTKVFRLHRVKGSARSRVRLALKLKLPRRALADLKRGARETLQATLTAANANGRSTKHASKRLKRPRKRR